MENRAFAKIAKALFRFSVSALSLCPIRAAAAGFAAGLRRTGASAVGAAGAVGIRILCAFAAVAFLNHAQFHHFNGIQKKTLHGKNLLSFVFSIEPVARIEDNVLSAL